MGWFTPRRSRSLAGSHGRSSKALLASRARAVLLLLAMVAALAPQAFAQTTPNPVRWTNPGVGAANWAQLRVGTASLTGKLMLQQSVTLTRAGGVQWQHAGVSACPWTRVTPTPAFPPTTECQTLIAEGAGSGGGSSFTAPGFVPTQAMIDNGGVVIRVTWNLFMSNVVMTQWVPLLPPPNAALVLTPASISENAGVSTVTAVLDGTTSAATTITVSAAASGDFALSAATTLTIMAGATTSAGTVTVTANDNDVDAPDKSVTVSGTATGDVVEDPPDVTLTLRDDDTAGFVFEPSGILTVAAGGAASTYRAKLSSEPTGAVTVSITSDNGDVTVDPARLTFDAANWDMARTVTVTAAADGDDFADTATLSHEASGGGYNGVKEGVLSAAVAGGGVRIAASGGTRTESVYVVNGHLVTVTESPGVPPGVEIDLPSDLDEAVSVTLKPVKDAPQESGSFSLAHEGASAMVDVSVEPVPSGGVELCLTPPAGVLEAAGRAPGREVTLLHYTGGAWTAVKGSTWDESRSRVCAGGVTSFAPFAVGYANTKPKFASTQSALMFTVDEAIDPVTLPAATGGDGTLLYALTPALPRGVERTDRRLSGTPTEAFERKTYTWTATDKDGDETAPVTFTIEVEHGLEKARARLKAINESVLPELSRALWGSAVDAVTGRLESPDAAAPTAAGGLEAAAGFVRANEGALEESDVSWKELLGGESFAFGLADGEGGSGFGGVVAWGSGDWRRLSRDEDALDWSGDAFSAHVGADAALQPGLRAGLAASWFASDVDYTDRSQGEAITGSHESRMTSLTPYVGWDGAMERVCGGRPVTARARSRSWTRTCASGSGRRKRTAGSLRAPRAVRRACGPRAL